MNVAERSKFQQKPPLFLRNCVSAVAAYLCMQGRGPSGRNAKQPVQARERPSRQGGGRTLMMRLDKKPLWNSSTVARSAMQRSKVSFSSASGRRVALQAAPVQAAGDDDNKKRGGERGNNPGTAVITKTKPQTKRPNLYRVLILNDDYTPMEFVVHVLERFFNKDREAATRIMLHVHHHGIGECGVFTYEVAETKVTQVMDFARKHQHPLQCVMEKK
jgi:ATP-dependent Clp protease adaptor protein ClpS